MSEEWLHIIKITMIVLWIPPFIGLAIWLWRWRKLGSLARLPRLGWVVPLTAALICQAAAFIWSRLDLILVFNE